MAHKLVDMEVDELKSISNMTPDRLVISSEQWRTLYNLPNFGVMLDNASLFGADLSSNDTAVAMKPPSSHFRWQHSSKPFRKFTRGPRTNSRSRIFLFRMKNQITLGRSWCRCNCLWWRFRHGLFYLMKRLTDLHCRSSSNAPGTWTRFGDWS